MSLEAGKQLGPYQIEGAIGAGGMGEVYRATDTRLGRTVAIKVLPEHLSSHPELAQRFEREARTISNLKHPHICALYDVGREGDISFLVMEYLEGETLAERLAKGPIPSEDVLRFGIQITDALDHAHRAGVIHRDLKPGNIIITREGAKLLDFGLARTLETETTTASSLSKMATLAKPGSDSLTSPGTVLGTFQYMAPEQLEGGNADARTDIFSLGAVLYEMATGRKAFAGKSQASLIAAIMTSRPDPISQVAPMSPPALDRVVGTCLEKDPEDRWQTAHDVALQLKWIAEGGSQVGVPRSISSRRRNRERTAWIAAAVLGIAAIAMGARALLSPKPPAPEVMRFEISLPEGMQSYGSPRISPDGKYIAFDGTDSTGTQGMWLRPLSTPQTTPIGDSKDCRRAIWSPDGQNVAFFTAGRLRRVPIAGGAALTVAEFPRGADGSWGTKGHILFDAGASDTLHVVSAAGGIPKAATSLDRERGDTGHAWPMFIPDGERFLYVAYGPSPIGELRLARLGSFEYTVIAETGLRVEYAEPGYLLYDLKKTLVAQAFDARAGKVIGDPFPLVESVGSGGLGLSHFSASNNGVFIYLTGESEERQMILVDRKGRMLQTVGPHADLNNPALSPDGRLVAFRVAPEGSQDEDIWITDIARGVTSRMTFGGGAVPVWSPDGKRVLYSPSSNGNLSGLHIGYADGTGAIDTLSTASDEAAGDWASAGIATMRFTTGVDVGYYENKKAAWQPLANTQSLELSPMLAPGGRYVAYASNESGTFQVYVQSLSPGGGKWQVSRDGGLQPFWRADGREMYFLSTERAVMAVDILSLQPPTFGIPQILFASGSVDPTFQRNTFVPAGDGQKFLLIKTTETQNRPLTVVLNWAEEIRARR